MLRITCIPFKVLIKCSKAHHMAWNSIFFRFQSLMPAQLAKMVMNGFDIHDPDVISTYHRFMKARSKRETSLFECDVIMLCESRNCVAMDHVYDAHRPIELFKTFSGDQHPSFISHFEI